MSGFTSTAVLEARDREFTFKVLGRILEHLGVQMYKQRPAAIAELVANSWDAGATDVWIDVPDPATYDPLRDTITIEDNGAGMTEDAVQDEYLVVARNRRERDSGVTVEAGAPEQQRLVMGRKGIGKLAGFGIAKVMTVWTWTKDGEPVQFKLNATDLKTGDNDVKDCPVNGRVGIDVPSPRGQSGTRVILAELKHKAPLDPDELRMTLARRLSRHVKGRMRIWVNNRQVAEPVYEPPIKERHPDDPYLESATLDDGHSVRYWYGFTEKPVKPKALQGFTMLVRGKTAQAAPFYFGAESGTAQHAAKYITGVIEADFLDDGTSSDKDDEADIISTDRQEIEWEHPRAASLNRWGSAFCRNLFETWRDTRAKQLTHWILEDAEFVGRLKHLAEAERKQVEGFLKTLSEVEEPTDRARDLASSLVRAFEFRHFHDVIEELNRASANPEMLQELLVRLHDWRVLESRAILEVVQGRLAIIDKFERMLVTDAPETAPRTGMSNMHDLLADYPWLLNPKYQLLLEERGVTSLLREWADGEIKDQDYRGRIDFLGLSDEQRLVVIEIKRPDHALTHDEALRLLGYCEKLRRAHQERIVDAVLIWGGAVNFTDQSFRALQSGLTLIKWSELFESARRHYEHHRVVLEADVRHPDFQRKESEVRRTRDVIESGEVYRGERRKEGLGGQDVDYRDRVGGHSDVQIEDDSIADSEPGESSESGTS